MSFFLNRILQDYCTCSIINRLLARFPLKSQKNANYNIYYILKMRIDSMHVEEMKNKNEGRLYYRELYEHHIRVNQLIYTLLIF